MSKISAYKELLNKRIKVICTDGEILMGEWIDWTSEWDNEPDPESITIRNKDDVCIEIFVQDIKQITAVSE